MRRSEIYEIMDVATPSQVIDDKFDAKLKRDEFWPEASLSRNFKESKKRNRRQLKHLENRERLMEGNHRFLMKDREENQQKIETVQLAAKKLVDRDRKDKIRKMQINQKMKNQLKTKLRKYVIFDY